MRQLIYKVIGLWLFLFLCNSLQAQQKRKVRQQRFNVGFLFGFNLSQLDGDDAQGYKKFGLQTGLRVVGRISREFNMSTEIYYTQLGSKFSSRRRLATGDTKEVIGLDYMTIPLMFNKLFRRINPSKDVDYHRYQLSGGVAYSRLIRSSITEDEKDDVDYLASSFLFNNNDISLQVGGSIFINQHLVIEGRSSISVNKIFDRREHPEVNTGLVLLRNYYLMARVIYLL